MFHRHHPRTLKDPSRQWAGTASYAAGPHRSPGHLLTYHAFSVVAPVDRGLDDRPYHLESYYPPALGRRHRSPTNTYLSLVYLCIL